ncbi:NAD(P)/FAD-dependent oxidoreductase [Bradyrhizobium sp. U87765 SZCCT0131]|uniref:NAD(P)-binding domain-containing protein n=1 Tax=unclassified Bradyrhizobium TaxID=2631580 RepID=UPI001BA54DF6|nr:MULTISPECIES: NAD(P)/FAD-dependent oxidoreductase [unclassified Bradyrhizobium]MBR1220966.1 NAD(P)/FAD-dependent oxidoreductase [Bradyrhizobium sp. U87765 SZCCT0131]MBR1260214.1 NAD(P)/FAD-dependent oxidoreductase [Bradyrhizobium sp. U87765 SZCCT0134]MBR1307537.1 NAD(P)/FAD-dependent oxidoreductase [Bradyrhizobium sp. U87765 SZCCT0110]MBR1321491.1 NAD(P)/FAD-dependent oxidoreductase [Bradyrhizobium sp. U87765 SZCCT0109]MBR1349804.1 NAD(P)/FAD-dependent oxidoreductase [Bradyrhizobium sp. U87
MDQTSAHHHDAAVARDLACLGLPPDNWPAAATGPDGTPVLDVLIVGAGMNGIAAAGSLLFRGVRNIAVIDRADPGREGPWLTYARMGTLRSPKTLPGPALGIPSLTYRAWHEARFGTADWERLYKIPNELWAAYLTWLQRVLSLPVRHRTSLVALTPAGRHLRARLDAAGEAQELIARRVILATGRGGTGGDAWPAFVDRDLAPQFAAHTNDPIDFERLRGKSIAIIGGGASGWDNAATALEQGAARVDMYVRRKVLPQVNKGRGTAFPGFLQGWSALPDAERWRYMAYFNDVQSPVPHETVHRTLAQPDFHIHLGCPVRAVARDGDGVAVTLAGEAAPRRHDFAIVATGFNVDTRAIPELAAFAGDIATWGDRYAPPAELARDDLARFPYLGAGFELTERVAGCNPALAHIHLVNHGATLSHTAIASDIPGVNIAAERVSGAISASLFCEDAEAIRRRVEAFDEPELQGTPFYMPPDERD